MLSGRKHVVNDLTCKYVSGVNYVFLQYEQLYMHSGFNVKCVHDLFKLAG